MVRRYIELVLRYRLLVVALCLIASIAGSVIVSQGVFASSLIKLFFGNSPDYSRYRDLADQFGESDVIVIAVEDAALFSASGWERLDTITGELEAHPEIRRVASISNAQWLESEKDGLAIRSYAEAVRTGSVTLEEAEEKIRSSEVLSNTLVGVEEGVPALVIELLPNHDRPVEALPAFMEEIFGVFYRQGLERSQLHVAGFVPETIEVTAQARYSMATVFPITALVLVCIVFMLFGQLWPVIATSGVGLIAILWTFTFAILLDDEINLMMAMVPAVMMVVSFSDIVHLCSAYVLDLKEGYPKQVAIIKSATEVGQACFFTSVTTFFGFMAIAFVPTPVFQRLGIVLGFGVAIALLLAMTLVPIFFSLMPTPDIHAENRFVGMARLIDWITFQCNHVATGWPRSVVVGFVILTVTAIYGLTLIKVETNLQERLEPDNHIRQSQVFIQKHFAGTNVLDVYLTSDEPDELLTPAALRSFQKVQDELERRPEIDLTLSMVDVLEGLHAELAGAAPGELPDSRALISQYLLLFDLSGGEGLEAFVDQERQTARVTVRIPEAGLVTAAHLGDEIGAMFGKEFGAGVQVEVTGLSYLFGKWVDFIIQGQKRGLAFAFFTTTILMILCLRLWGAGLVSMIPNALPLMVLGAVLGYSRNSVDSDLMMIGMIAIGIAVDDTIHYLTRLRIEASRVDNMDEALWKTSQVTGRAIVQTSIILCLGLLPFLMSDYLTTWMLGSLLPLTLVMALISDLLLLPALVKLRLLRIPTGTALEGEQLHPQPRAASI